jgi:hypothetical protein
MPGLNGVATGFGLAAILFATSTACTGLPSATSETSASKPAQPNVDSFPLASAAACVDTQKSELEAVAGRIHAGPFAGNRDHWTQPHGTKLWVGSSRDRPPAPALIDGVWKDGNFQVHQRRGVDQLAIVEGLPLFYPGTLRLPKSGSWRLTITIGQDQGCFVVVA